jgi:hypothetical protein
MLVLRDGVWLGPCFTVAPSGDSVSCCHDMSCCLKVDGEFESRVIDRSQMNSDGCSAQRPPMLVRDHGLL